MKQCHAYALLSLFFCYNPTLLHFIFYFPLWHPLSLLSFILPLLHIYSTSSYLHVFLHFLILLLSIATGMSYFIFAEHHNSILQMVLEMSLTVALPSTPHLHFNHLWLTLVLQWSTPHPSLQNALVVYQSSTHCFPSTSQLYDPLSFNQLFPLHLSPLCPNIDLHCNPAPMNPLIYPLSCLQKESWGILPQRLPAWWLERSFQYDTSQCMLIGPSFLHQISAN